MLWCTCRIVLSQQFDHLDPGRNVSMLVKVLQYSKSKLPKWPFAVVCFFSKQRATLIYLNVNRYFEGKNHPGSILIDIWELSTRLEKQQHDPSKGILFSPISINVVAVNNMIYQLIGSDQSDQTASLSCRKRNLWTSIKWKIRYV